jgi:PfaD family protein
MFEIGAEVQVLGLGSMYAQRAGRLYELYRRHRSLEEIPAADREKVERTIFGAPIDQIWAQTAQYWRARDAAELARAEQDPHHRMALTFRWYLGQSSRWARRGEGGRQRDYQIWCGPAMGLFNDWTRGTPLAELPQRRVVEVGEALLRGAAALQRQELARALGWEG